MPQLTRREWLSWFALAPTLPRFFVQSAQAATPAAGYDGPVVVVVRMIGGNDGLNTVVPIHDDRYYEARPTIAIPSRQALSMPGGDVGLNPWLADVRELMEEGHAGIVQGIGYPSPSRSHLRATEIWESGSLNPTAPSEGWLGRYLDHACECGNEPLAGLQFAEELGLTLATRTGRSQTIAHDGPLLDFDPRDPGLAEAAARGSRSSRLDYLRQVENGLGYASRQLHRAAKGRGTAHDYPDTEFGRSLRWTGDMIETGCPTRTYYVTIGSVDGADAVSFDTHIDQLAKHRLLFEEFGRGLRAFTDHLQKSGHFGRVLLLTFSDFGRQLAENKTNGTDHGDAGVLFYLGGGVQAGLQGTPVDLGDVRNGGVQATVDFRGVYADVLQNWLNVDAGPILGDDVDPFRIVSRQRA
ncbi:MAG: DUF1501 domain-containing protein [Acidobacteriota bacterium]